MRGLLVVLSLLLAWPASAAEMTLTLNDEEQAVLRQLLDLATKSGGLAVAPAALHFANKIEAQKQPKPEAKVAPSTPQN